MFYSSVNICINTFGEDIEIDEFADAVFLDR